MPPFYSLGPPARAATAPQGCRLSAHRLVFLAESPADLATRRSVEIHRGDPRQVLAGRPLAVTYPPVPGFGVRAGKLDIVALHPLALAPAPARRLARLLHGLGPRLIRRATPRRR